MNKFITTFFLLFISFQLNSQFLPHQYEFDKVQNERNSLKKHKISKIYEYSSEKLVKSKKDLFLAKSTEFDEDGFKIKETYFDPEQESISFNFFYNTDGKLFKTVLANYDNFDFLSTYTYDSSKKLIEEFHIGGENRKYIIKYDDKGNIAEKIGYSGSLPFDENGEIVENAEPIWDYIDRYEYEYNSKGDITIERFYFFDNLSYTNLFFHDKTGKRTKWVNRFGDNYDIVYLYNYDKKGLLQHIKVTDPKETKYIIYSYEFYK